MTSKRWQPWDCDSCPSCGDDAEVFTDCPQAERAFDGDKARCVFCGHPGSVNVHGDGEFDDGQSSAASIAWHDDPACPCEWCSQDRAKGAKQ